MTKLNILVIHGMGSQEQYYSHPMRDEINKWLGEMLAGQLTWAEVYWADVLRDRQKEYLDQARRHHDLDFISMRRFMVNSVSDASAYRKNTDKRDTVYDDVHTKVDKVMDKLDDPAAPDRPLVLLAHSLGGHIMSNYIWDRQKPGASPAGTSSFRKLETLAGMITFGCNIPFFTFAYKKSDINPIRFPGSKLPPVLDLLARWKNYYDPDDILGYPLQPINHAYSKLVQRRGHLHQLEPAVAQQILDRQRFHQASGRFPQGAARGCVRGRTVIARRGHRPRRSSPRECETGACHPPRETLPPTVPCISWLPLTSPRDVKGMTNSSPLLRRVNTSR